MLEKLIWTDVLDQGKMVTNQSIIFFQTFFSAWLNHWTRVCLSSSNLIVFQIQWTAAAAQITLVSRVTTCWTCAISAPLLPAALGDKNRDWDFKSSLIPIFCWAQGAKIISSKKWYQVKSTLRLKIGENQVLLDNVTRLSKPIKFFNFQEVL